MKVKLNKTEIEFIKGLVKSQEGKSDEIDLLVDSILRKLTGED